MGLHYALTS